MRVLDSSVVPKQLLRWTSPGFGIPDQQLSADPDCREQTAPRGSQGTRAVKWKDHKSDSQHAWGCNTLFLGFATLLPLHKELRGLHRAFAYPIQYFSTHAAEGN